MRSVKLITARCKRMIALVLGTGSLLTASAQENSPYSRYGVGDIVPNQNIISRGMGGISAGYSDYQGLNFNNPAAMANLSLTVFDLGGEVDIRTLKSTATPEKYTGTNTLISYFQLGFPLTSAKMKKKNNAWGLNFGLKPYSRISYKILKEERIPGVDSLHTLYQGSGGISQVNLGTAFKINDFSMGVNAGFTFGSKDYNTQLELVNDSLVYYKSNHAVTSNFNGFFLNLGVQYLIRREKYKINLGAYANLQQNLRGKKDEIEETFSYLNLGGITNIDTVRYGGQIKGTVVLPATYGMGFSYTGKNWLYGADFEMTNWNKFKYYGQEDAVQDNWVIRAGAQYYPAKDNTPSTRYFKFVKYRGGFYYGPDYIKIDKTRPVYAFTIGAGFPLTAVQRIRFGEYVLFNLGLEFGARGNKESTSMRENFTRIAFGLTMNAKWFQKRSYD